jgi:hypothetical protein
MSTSKSSTIVHVFVEMKRHIGPEIIIFENSFWFHTN